MTDQTIDVDKMTAEIVLPSQDAFMKVNSIDSCSMTKNTEVKNKNEGGRV